MSEQHSELAQTIRRGFTGFSRHSDPAHDALDSLIEQLEAERTAGHECREHYMRLKEQLEAAQRVLAVADHLAEWCRVTTTVDGVFSNNIGAQAQAQGMANIVTRYAAARESSPAGEPQ